MFLSIDVLDEVSVAEQQVAQVNTEREQCRVDLRDNLLKRQEELQASLASLLGTGAIEGEQDVVEEERGDEESKSSRKGKFQNKTKKTSSLSSSHPHTTAFEISDQALLQEAETRCKVELQRVSQSAREQESEVNYTILTNWIFLLLVIAFHATFLPY